MGLTKKYNENKLSLLFESVRLETFRNKWIFDDHQICSASNLARTGFYYTGTNDDVDSVTCFLCDKSLEGWRADDDPWKEHREHNNNCYFVLIGKPECDLTVHEFFDIWNALRLNTVKNNRSMIKQTRATILKEYVAMIKSVSSTF